MSSLVYNHLKLRITVLSSVAEAKPFISPQGADPPLQTPSCSYSTSAQYGQTNHRLYIGKVYSAKSYTHEQFMNIKFHFELEWHSVECVLCQGQTMNSVIFSQTLFKLEEIIHVVRTSLLWMSSYLCWCGRTRYAVGHSLMCFFNKCLDNNGAEAYRNKYVRHASLDS